MADNDLSTPKKDVRCPNCDSVIPAGRDRCVMCGERLETVEPVPESGEVSIETAAPVAPDRVHEEQVAKAPRSTVAGEEDGVIVSPIEERQSPVVLLMTLVAIVLTALVGWLVVRYAGPVQLALVPTATPLQPTPTFTPTVTLAPSQTPAPATPTMTPAPTEPPPPPQVHEVRSGETLYGLSLTYNVSMESIAAMNGIDVETPLQQGQALNVPWPTATPPLAPVMLEVNGQTVVADPTNCERYTIAEGDALSLVAARYNIDFALLQDVNRLTEDTILRPGDTICIPEISYGGVLPPTPGPSPTAGPTAVASGPQLLYPADDTVVEMADEPVVLQWVAVKDLAVDEWYMIEVRDLSTFNQHPVRGFTRENAFRVPESWRPDDEEYHPLEWRVSVVRVTGQREDGGLIYTFGGRSSEPATFTWLGAIPTPTPTPTNTPTPTPE